MHLSTARHPHFLGWAGEACKREDPQAVQGRQQLGSRQRRPIERHQEIHRYGLARQLPQCEQSVDYLVIALAHTYDQARARRQARLLGLCHRRDAIVVSVRGTDLAIARLAGIQIVVVRVDACSLQALSLAVAEDAKASAYLDLWVLRFQLVNDLRDTLNVAGTRATATGNH